MKVWYDNNYNKLYCEAYHGAVMQIFKGITDQDILHKAKENIINILREEGYLEKESA